VARKSKPPSQDTPQALQLEYERLKRRLLQIGFICRGSLGEQWLTCGKSNCRCHDDSSQRHGPYFHLTWKESGKTVGRYISPDLARLYREWIDNRRSLDDIIQQMYAISQRAQSRLLPPQKPKSSSRKRRSPRARKTRKPS
jgi:hypothetical protein